MSDLELPSGYWPLYDPDGIRPAQPLDHPAIVALWNRLQELSASAEPSLETTADGRLWYKDYLWDRLHDPKASVLVASVDGLRVGYSHAQIQQRPTLREHRCGFLAEVVVHEEYRRQGIGRSLVNAQMNWFREQGIARIEVQVLDNNPDAVAFWARMGFGNYLRTLARDV